MDEEFIVQALGLSIVLMAALWLLNPFMPTYDMRANFMNFAMLLTCSLMSLVILQFGEMEFKTRLSMESFSLFAGVIVLSAALSYSIVEYGTPLSTNPYPLLPAIFFLLPMVQLFVRERL